VHERDVGRVEAAVRESLTDAGTGAQVFVSLGRNTEARVEAPGSAYESAVAALLRDLGRSS
jgi:hypothetical protein